MQPEQAESFQDFVNKLSNDYDDLTLERHVEGAKKYGPLKFASVDTLEEAIAEILDLGNYARYTFIKLRILQASLAGMEMPTEIQISQFKSNMDKRF